MGLRDEWDELRAAAGRLADDAVHLSTETRRRDGATTLASIHSAMQLDGDVTTTITGDARALVAHHRAALAFSAELVEARLRTLARLAGSLVS